MVSAISSDQRDKCAVCWKHLPNVSEVMQYLFAETLSAILDVSMTWVQRAYFLILWVYTRFITCTKETSGYWTELHVPMKSWSCGIGLCVSQRTQIAIWFTLVGEETRPFPSMSLCKLEIQTKLNGIKALNVIPFYLFLFFILELVLIK